MLLRWEVVADSADDVAGLNVYLYSLNGYVASYELRDLDLYNI